MSSFFFFCIYIYLSYFVQITVTAFNNKASLLDLLSGVSYSYSHTDCNVDSGPIWSNVPLPNP